MTGYLIRRLIQTIVVTLLVTIITFVLLHLVPGGEIRAVLGLKATPAEIAAYSKAYGFDQPLYVQYLKWLWQLLHGNFGFDIIHSAPVSTLLWPALVRTVVLAVIGTAVGLLIGVPLGILPGGAPVHGARPRCHRRRLRRLRVADLLRRPHAGQLVRR